jgi:hypothetical protein
LTVTEGGKSSRIKSANDRSNIGITTDQVLILWAVLIAITLRGFGKQTGFTATEMKEMQDFASNLDGPSL